MRFRHPPASHTSVVTVGGPTRAATTALRTQMLDDWPRTRRHRRHSRQESIFPSDRRHGRLAVKRLFRSGL